MVKTLKNLRFPVFPIPNGGKIDIQGQKIYYITNKSCNSYLIDDKSLSGTFTVRRVISTEKLLPLKRAVLTLGNLVLYSKLYKHFIDSNGMLFTYKKSFTAPIMSVKIERIVPYKSGSILLLENIHCPFIFYRPVNFEEKFAILALVSKGYLLLGLSKTNYLRRKTIRL